MKTLVVILCLFSMAFLPAQADETKTGDAAIAEKYLLWAEDAIADGEWSQAMAALERASDFADVLSDISYLLAIARSKGDESRRSVLQALELAIGTGRWLHYTEAQARLLEADQLIALRRYSAALDSLAAYRVAVGEDADSALLRLAALKGMIRDNQRPGIAGAGAMPVLAEFRRRMLETMDRYPRDPRPLRVLFNFAYGLKSSGQNPAASDLVLIEIALKRLPYLLELDPDLAWMAVPFIGDTGEARRLVSSYRADGLASSARSSSGKSFRPSPNSIIPALNLGLIDDTQAIDELFLETNLEKEHIAHIGRLLRGDDGREYLCRKLHEFTGAIIENEDADDYPESRAVYLQGSLREYYSDADQDGVTNLYVSFIDNAPRQVKYEDGVTRAEVRWERYPYVRTAVLDSEMYIAAPGAFPFSPVHLTELGAAGNSAGIIFPERDTLSPKINRRMLATNAVSVHHPSTEFEGGMEKVLLEQGIPVRAEVTVRNMLTAVTEYRNGSPFIQRLDLDQDGRMETIRRFRHDGVRSSESDWSGTGAFSTAELYQEDGSVVYIWDLDGKGMYRYSETRE